MSDQSVALRGRVVLVDSIIDDGVVVIEGERIAWVGPCADVAFAAPAFSEALAATEPSTRTLLPGLVDVHCHGGGGASFPNAETPEEAMIAVHEHRLHGTTTMVASCVTAEPDVLRRRADMLGGLAKDGEIAGVHFEGPFVSHERRGAQDATYIIPPDPALTAELIERTGSATVTMTVAPEKDAAYGPGSVAEVLIQGGALPSWGHTDSDPASAREALEYSRTLLKDTPHARSSRVTITHLFNGMKPLHHRDPGPIAEFLSDAARGGAIVEMICDGVHLDPSIVRDVTEMVGRESCVLVTDAMAAAGMPDGEYVLGPQGVTVADGVARITVDGSIAGGTSHLLDCVRVASGAGIALVDAVYMASVQGAEIIGDPTIGRLEAGCWADVVEVDEDLRPVVVWRRGVQVS